jgi:hypothetical protein
LRAFGEILTTIGKGLLRGYSGHYRKLPVVWIIAHKVMRAMEPTLLLRIMECSYIQHSEILLSHILNISKAHGISVPDGRTLKMLSSHGVVHLVDTGSWRIINDHVIDFKSHIKPPGESEWMKKCKETWNQVTQALNNLDPKWFTIGDLDLMITRDLR